MLNIVERSDEELMSVKHGRSAFHDALKLVMDGETRVHVTDEEGKVPDYDYLRAYKQKKVDGLIYIGLKKLPEEMLAELYALNIFSWESNYVRLGFDGTEWALVLTDGDRIYRGIGARNYPPNFEEFRNWVDKLVEAVKIHDTTN